MIQSHTNSTHPISKSIIGFHKTIATIPACYILSGTLSEWQKLVKYVYCIIAIFAFLLAARNSMAQDTLSFHDDFSDNRNGWLITDEAELTTTMQDGKYTHHNKTADKAKWTNKEVFLEPRKDFIIETVITHTAGDNNTGYGLVWGLNSAAKDYYVFSVASTKYYKIYGYIQNKLIEIQPWIKSEIVNGLNVPNKLRVEVKNNMQTFYINDTKVFSAPYTVLRGNRIGFISNSNLSMSIDYVTLKQDVPKHINVIKNLTSGFKKENLGASINSEYTEGMPIIAPDGKTLYLFRENHPQNIEGAKSDIWYSTLSPAGVWQPMQNIGKPLNNSGPNFVISVTPDNNTLLLGNRYKTSGAGFSISHRTDSGWSMPEDVIMKNYVNKNQYTTSYLANNGKVIVTSAETDYSYGDTDLHVSFLQENGEWSEPKNMGTVINTFGAEFSPFLAADGVTMYYSSNGKRGYGSNDIYKTTRLDDTWANWSEPENLGAEINSSGWDAYYTFPASGEYALVVSDQNSLGSIDVFKIQVPLQARPKPVVLIHGKVIDSKTKKTLEAKIAYNELKTDKEIGIANSSPADGTYKIVLPAGQAYSFLASKENYYAISENIDLTKITEYKEIEKDLYLSPVEVGATVRLNNIFFDTGKSDLRNESAPEMERVIKFLNQNATVEIEVSGHTDNVGADDANKKLSQDRANTLYSYLINKGIGEKRIKSMGYGEAKPVASNETTDGKQQNRRVEFTITKK